MIESSFRDNEIRALLEMRGITSTDMKWVREGIEGDETAFMEIDLPSEDDAKFLGSRSVSIKGIFEPWGSGVSCEQCLESAKAYAEPLKAPYLAQGTTFKINVVSVGGNIDDYERTQIIQTCFKYIDFQGKVVMDQTRKGVRAGKGPRAQNQFWWLEDVGNPPHASTSKGLAPHLRWFAREVALGQRPLLDKYDLKKRKYLCSTSMSAGISLSSVLYIYHKVFPQVYSADSADMSQHEQSCRFWWPILRTAALVVWSSIPSAGRPRCSSPLLTSAPTRSAQTSTSASFEARNKTKLCQATVASRGASRTSR